MGFLGFFKGFQVGLCSEKSCCLIVWLIVLINVRENCSSAQRPQCTNLCTFKGGNREFKEGINRIKKSVLGLLETLSTHEQQNGSMMKLWRGWNTRLEPEVTILEQKVFGWGQNRAWEGGQAGHTFNEKENKSSLR